MRHLQKLVTFGSRFGVGQSKLKELINVDYKEVETWFLAYCIKDVLLAKAIVDKLLRNKQHRLAEIAIRAAKNRHNWGRWPARRYCEKRGVPMGLYRLACQLEASERGLV